ncbi:MAG: Glu-tRNA(Gln) amidotransferase subunit GatE [Nitrososphaeria archaeon]|nr:Glu-tRNA(Gln) amidotransferase subunit GatE [Nitrososphaeria archaeon]
METRPFKAKVGLELHQQLNVGRKLFCDCPIMEYAEAEYKILRYLRPTQSELGEVDPAVMFEFRKNKANIYIYNSKASCLVECDEEPPHPINMDAVKAAITVALALGSKVVEELHVMRKIVIDGSNTTGFQRTVLVALDGVLKADDIEVPVQTISVEEDAARLVEERDDAKVFSLDRLGVPLIEISLAPIEADPKTVERVALALGRLLRLTGFAARGIGTIRQDINISIEGFPPCEVKGVQKLDLIPKIIEYEMMRQYHLYNVARLLKEKGLDSISSIGEYVDVTCLFEGASSRIVRNALDNGKKVYGIKLKGFRGLFKMEPYPNVRLGLELADMARAYGLGGIIHSDELPAYGISSEDVERVKAYLSVEESDAFVLVLAGERDYDALSALRQRMLRFFEGPVPETRGPTGDGRTRYSRPRPGSARMYPETDIPLIRVTRELIEECRKFVPKPWSEVLRDYMQKYGLNEKLANQILDSVYLGLFEKVCSMTKLSPTLVAVVLTEHLVTVSREGLDISVLDEGMLFELFQLLDSGRVSKESVIDILKCMCKEGVSAGDCVKRLGLKPISEEDLAKMVHETVVSNRAIVESLKERSFGPLMGMLMEKVRGKADGGKVSRLLKEEIAKLLQNI